MLFPAICLGCGTEGQGYACESCVNRLEPSFSVVGGAELLTLGEYEGLLSRCISQVKNQGRKSLAEELGRHSASFLKRRWHSRPITSVLPLASSRQGRRFRGFSLPLILAKSIGRECGWALLEQEQAALFPQQERSSQGLDLAGRLRRAEPSVASKDSVQPRGSLLLVDDVVTSGSTMLAAVETAYRLGWKPVQCFALAAVSGDW